MVGAPKDESRRFNWSPAWIALAFSVGGFLWQVGVTSQRVNDNIRRVELLEAADRQRGDALSRIDARTARIEATLDFMRGGTVQRPLSVPLPANPDQQEGGNP